MVVKKSTRAAVLTVSAEEVVDAFGKFLKVFASYQEQEGGDAVTPAKSKSASAAKSKPAAAEEPEETYTSEEIAGMGIKDLRALAVELELDEVKVKQAIIDELTEKGFIVDEDDDDEDEDEDEDDDEADDDDEDDEDEDDEDEDEDDEEEDEGYSREELEEMSLADIRKLAREEGIKVPRGSDQDAIIELILGEDEDEDEDDDEEEADDKKDEAEDEEITEEEIRAMSLKELQGLAKELGVKVKVPTTAKTSTAKQKAYADAILATVDDE